MMVEKVRFVIFYFLHNRFCIVFDFGVQMHLYRDAAEYFVGFYK